MGLLTLSGCIGGDQQAVKTVTVRVTKNPTTTSTRTSTTTHEPKTRTTTTETTTATSTPDPADIAAAQIETATAHLTDAFSIYVDYAGNINASFLTVTATTTNFNPSPIEQHVENTETALSKADANASEQQKTTIQKLREVAEFLRFAARTQAELVSGYQAVTKANNAFRAARWGNISKYGTDTELSGKLAAKLVTETKKRSSVNSTTALDVLSKSLYTKKVTQLENQASALQTLGIQFKRLDTATWQYDEGIAEYNNEDYQNAVGSLAAAHEDFSRIVDSIQNQEHKQPVSGLYSDVKCFSVALRNACQHFKQAAEANNSETREKYEEKGDNALKSCAVVQDILGEVN